MEGLVLLLHTSVCDNPWKCNYCTFPLKHSKLIENVLKPFMVLYYVIIEMNVNC